MSKQTTTPQKVGKNSYKYNGYTITTVKLDDSSFHAKVEMYEGDKFVGRFVKLDGYAVTKVVAIAMATRLIDFEVQK